MEFSYIIKLLTFYILPVVSVVLCGFMLVSKNRKCIWFALPVSFAVFFLPAFVYWNIDYTTGDGIFVLILIGLFFALPAVFIELLVAMHIKKQFEHKALLLLFTGVSATFAISVFLENPIYCTIAFALWHV